MSRRPGTRIGAVTLYQPTGARPYFRLAYTDTTGMRCHMSAGKDELVATELAAALNESLAETPAAAGSAGTTPASPAADRTLGDLAAEYVSTPRGRKRSKFGRALDEDWAPNHHHGVKQDMKRAIVGVEHVCARQLDRQTVDHMRSACGTPGMVDQMTRTVRGFLYWAEVQDALTATQAELLPPGGRRTVRPRFPQPERRPRRREDVREQGQDERHIREEDAPAASRVCAFADRLQAQFTWGALAVHTAAGAGLRQGEQFQLCADDLRMHRDPTTGQKYWYVAGEWQWCATTASKGRRTRPKHGKTRRVPVPEITATGYPLLEKLLERQTQARAEKAAGTNPQALLFPTKGGKIWQTSSLSAVVVRAQKAADWEYTVVTEMRTLRNGKREAIKVTQMERTWHSLRHRFARDMVDSGMKVGQLTAIGGWESIEVVSARYYRTGQEHVDGAAAVLQPSAHAGRRVTAA